MLQFNEDVRPDFKTLAKYISKLNLNKLPVIKSIYPEN